jgi:multidrug resistance efflux pump
MLYLVRAVVAVFVLCLATGCNRPLPRITEAASSAPETSPADSGKGEIRITGLIQAVHSVKIVVPQIQGQFGNLTLTRLIPNGTSVKEGDLIATFDPATQLDAARDAQAKFDDLSHQVAQKLAENRANDEKRMVDLRQAEGDQTKAELELQKGPILSEIDRLQSESKAQGARTRVASLKESMAFRAKADIAALHILELQRDRQKITIQRVEDNLKKLEIHAPLAGMVVHELLPRAGTLGKAQEGDQIYRGYPLASIFDPSQMLVRCSLNEPDVMALLANSRVSVHLDAYPDLTLPAHFLSASPVASSGLGTPIKTFVTMFGLDKSDPHLLPDLSASVVLIVPPAPSSPRGTK